MKSKRLVPTYFNMHHAFLFMNSLRKFKLHLYKQVPSLNCDELIHLTKSKNMFEKDFIELKAFFDKYLKDNKIELPLRYYVQD